MSCAFHLSFLWCDYYLLGLAWADGKGKLSSRRLRADSGVDAVKNVRLHSLDTLDASMNPKKKKTG
jgi:hypothetical protein